jgi:hypothetical protein
MDSEKMDCEKLSGKLLVQAATSLTVHAQDREGVITCEGRVTAILRPDGCIAVECLLHCGFVEISTVFPCLDATLSGEDQRGSFRLEGMAFTRQKFESTSEWQLLRGFADKLSAVRRAPKEGAPSAFLLLSIHVALGSAEARKALPNNSFSWIEMDQDDHLAPGVLSITVDGNRHSLEQPPVFIEAMTILLSLATMTTVFLVGVENADGTCEYQSTPPVRTRHGFQLIPQYSRSRRREELVYFLSGTVEYVVGLPEEKAKQLKKAILFLVESDYEEYIEFKYLKAYLALIVLARAFSPTDDPDIDGREHEFLEHLIKQARESGLSERFQNLVASRLSGLLEQNDRDVIEELLASLDLEHLLSKELTNRIRGSLIHTAVFRGRSLEEKVTACQELSLGISWAILRLLGYDGVFTHASKDSFYREVSVETGEEANTR